MYIHNYIKESLGVPVPLCKLTARDKKKDASKRTSNEVMVSVSVHRSADNMNSHNPFNSLLRSLIGRQNIN